MLLVVLAGVFELEAFGEVIVHLNRTQLPTAADGVFHHEVELRAVESGFAIFDAGVESLLFAGFDDGLFGAFPVVFRTDVLRTVGLVTERDLCFVVL